MAVKGCESQQMYLILQALLGKKDVRRGLNRDGFQGPAQGAADGRE